MGKIYFASDLRERTLKALMEAHDCADVKKTWTESNGRFNTGRTCRPGRLIGKCGKNIP